LSGHRGVEQYFEENANRQKKPHRFELREDIGCAGDAFLRKRLAVTRQPAEIRISGYSAAPPGCQSGAGFSLICRKKQDWPPPRPAAAKTNCRLARIPRKEATVEPLLAAGLDSTGPPLKTYFVVPLHPTLLDDLFLVSPLGTVFF
jgi:hypothetical protein